jgi:hypothetical protein
MAEPMEKTALTDRAPSPSGSMTRLHSLLGHPVAFLLTTLVLVLVFGWSFMTDGERAAPTKDPAYYTWRTEALISEGPETLVELRGPEIEGSGMFEGGYRVTAPVLGGMLRHLADIASLRTTVVLMVVLPVLIALLLGGFAYRQTRDPLAFHAVALGAGSLLLTPPFVGYLDNVLCLMFLAAALHFIPAARDSGWARGGLALFLVLSGLTHPTTLVIFCVTLGAMSFVRLIYRRFDLRSVIRDDAPLLVTAFLSAVLVVVIWTLGIWGESASLTESALPPPYGVDFFFDRMVAWLDTMHPLLNGPLFLIGIVGLLAAGRKAAEDHLSLVAIVWLAPLVGALGFLADKAYPYYRFFNTTLAWILLVGLGIWFAARFFIARGGLALLGLVALLAIVGNNFIQGLEQSKWNAEGAGWISDGTRADLDALRSHLDSLDEDTPVIFVIDDEPAQPFQIYGFTKLSGNTSRYGLPQGMIDRGHLYLGSLDNLLAGEPTLTGEETYDTLSPALLKDAEEGIAASGKEPVIVLASAFNQKGANAALFEDGGYPDDALVVTDGSVFTTSGDSQGVTGDETDAPSSGFFHLILVLVGFAAICLPGYFALRILVPGASLASALGLVPALGMALVASVSIVVLAIVRSPLSQGLAFLCLVLATLLVAVPAFRSRSAGTPQT